MDLDDFNLEDFFMQNYGDGQSGLRNETTQDFPSFTTSSSIANASYSSNNNSDTANNTSLPILITESTSQVGPQNALNLDGDFDWTSFLTDAIMQNARLETSGINSNQKFDTEHSSFTSSEYSTLHPVADVPDTLRDVLSTPKHKSGFLLPTAVNEFRTSYLYSDANNKNCGAQSGPKSHAEISELALRTYSPRQPPGPSDGTLSTPVTVPEIWDATTSDSTIRTSSSTEVPNSSYTTISFSSKASEISDAAISDCILGTISTSQTSNLSHGTLSISTTVPEISNLSRPVLSISSSDTDIPNQLQTHWPGATSQISASKETFTSPSVVSNVLHGDVPPIKSENEISDESCVVFCPNSSSENDFNWAEFFIGMPSLGNHEESSGRTIELASSDPVSSIIVTPKSEADNAGSHFEWNQNLTSTPVTSSQTTGFANFTESIHDTKIEYDEIVTVQSEGEILETKEQVNNSSIVGQVVGQNASEDSTLMLTDLDNMRIFEAPYIIYKNVPHTINHTSQHVAINENLSNLNIGERNKVQIDEISSATDKNSRYNQAGNSQKTKESIPVGNECSKDAQSDDDPDEIVFVSEKQLISRPIITRKPRATRFVTGDINTLLRCVEESIIVLDCASKVKVRKPRKYQYPPKYSTDASIFNAEVKREETTQMESPPSNDANKSNGIINLTELSDEDEDDTTIGKYRCLNCGRRFLMLKSLKAHKLRCFVNMSEQIDSIQSPPVLDHPVNFEIKAEINGQDVESVRKKEVNKVEEPTVAPMMFESRSMRPRRSKRILNKGDCSGELAETLTHSVKRKAQEQPDPLKVFVLERPQPVQIQQKNTSQTVKPYSCHLCDMSYILKPRFETHVKTHAECICQICQKSFGLRSQYTTHCRTCGKPSKRPKHKN